MIFDDVWHHGNMQELISRAKMKAEVAAVAAFAEAQSIAEMISCEDKIRRNRAIHARLLISRAMEKAAMEKAAAKAKAHDRRKLIERIRGDAGGQTCGTCDHARFRGDVGPCWNHDSGIFGSLFIVRTDSPACPDWAAKCERTIVSETPTVPRLFLDLLF